MYNYAVGRGKGDMGLLPMLLKPELYTDQRGKCWKGDMWGGDMWEEEEGGGLLQMTRD